MSNYNIFDGEDQEFTPVITSNANIKRVCEVLTQCAFKSHEERVYYAQIGDIAPGVDEEGGQIYTFKNIYHTKAQASAAIAERLFYDFPELLKVKEGSAEIINTELNEKLIRSEVWRAFEDWLGEFGENPFEVISFLSVLAKNPTLTTIVQAMSNLTVDSKNMNGSEITGNGSEISSVETDAGKK